MVIDVNVEIYPDRVHIQIPKAQISAEVSYLNMYARDALQRQAPDQAGERLEPGSGSSASAGIKYFDPYRITEVIRHHTEIGHDRLRPGLWKIWPFDRFRYTIQIPHYEALRQDICFWFEYRLREDLKADASSSINGQLIKKLYWKRSIPDIALGLLIILWVSAPFVIGVWIIEGTKWGEGPVSQTDIPLILIVGLPIGILVLLLGFFLAAVSWVLVVRNSVPEDLIMSRLYLFLPKSIARWLGQQLLGGDSEVH